MFEIVARSASPSWLKPWPGELHEAPDDAVLAQDLGDGQHQVGRRGALGQLAREAEADHLGRQQVQRLAEQHRLGLDAADAPAQDAQAVDHRGVRIGADQRCRGRPASSPLSERCVDDRRQVLEVDLVDDAAARRHDAEVLERLLRPAQQRVALLVALVLALDVQRRTRPSCRSSRPAPSGRSPGRPAPAD